MPKISQDVDRDEINSILKHTLKENSNIFDVFTAWEPDALDGNDGEFGCSHNP